MIMHKKSLHVTFGLVAALALASCDSGQVPSPADRLAGDVPVDTVDEGLVALHGEGLVAGPESFAGGDAIFGRDPDGNLLVLHKGADTSPFSAKNFADNGDLY